MKRILVGWFLTMGYTATTFGQSTLRPEFVLSSWLNGAQVFLSSHRISQLKGTADMFILRPDSSKIERKITWNVQEDGSKYRWEFFDPSVKAHNILTYDGKLYRGLTSSENPKVPHNAAVYNEEGLKIFGMQPPSEAFVHGMSEVYPFTLRQILLAPYIPEDVSQEMPKALLNLGKAVTIQQQSETVCTLSVASETARAHRLPENIQFRKSAQGWMPVKLFRTARTFMGQSEEEISLSYAEDQSMLPTRMTASVHTGETILASWKMSYDFRFSNEPPPPSFYQFELPDNTSMFDQPADKAYLYREAIPPKPTVWPWLVVVAAVGFAAMLWKRFRKSV